MPKVDHWPSSFRQQDVELVSLNQQLSEFSFRKHELESILESLYDGIGIVSADGTLLYVNESYRRITGLPKGADGVGTNVRELERTGVVSQAVALMVLREKRTFTIIQRIGTGKEVLITGSPVFDQKGQISCVACIIRDMKELINLKSQAESPAISNRLTSELNELRRRQLAHGELVFKSREMEKVFELTIRLSKVDCNVLVTGESGVGKEIIAKIIHNSSCRSKGPFLQINCGAIPENLLESELFGYEEGAFSGARKSGKMGYFELCNNGTLFLDEIGELPIGLQAKLLLAIQHRQILRLGGTTPIKVDVRIIAATNKNLEEMVAEKIFRADLYYRLNVVSVNIPPLRERPADIIPLAIHFLEQANKRYQTNKRFEPDILLAFEHHAWPGNVREMENLIERLVITSDEDIITSENVPFCLVKSSNRDITLTLHNILPIQKAVELIEKELLAKALQVHLSTRKAARVLGVSHPTIIRKLQKYQISR